MNNDITKSKVLSSLLWKMMERGGSQSFQLIVMIVLARLLLPKDFGLIVLVAIFISLSNVLIQSGFNTALIQKKDADEVDFSSVFFLNLFVASILYVVLFFSAPIIAIFFEETQITLILRILSITLFFGAINSIQNAIIARNMEFKKLFFSSLGAVLVSGIFGITMAYNDFGVWALVVQQLTNQLLVIVILWFTDKWRPKLLFSMERIIGLFSFGWKLLISALIDTIYTNISGLLIGKIFSPILLGFYSRGEQFPGFIVSNINGSIQSVMLPTLAAHQENRERVKEMVRRVIVTSSFIVFPMMIGLAIIAEPLVKILITEKWLPTVPFLQIFCAVYALWPIHTANLQAINALGRSDIFLKLEIVKKIFGFVVLVISIQFGVHAMAVGVLISGFLGTIINAYPNLKLLNYSIQEQWKDIMPSLLLSLVMGFVIFFIKSYAMSDILTIIIQIFIGTILYVALAKLFKLECFTYLLLTLKDMLENKKEKTKLIINNEVR
ncbi:polysaccharide biosynthesis protein [Lysinibacillus xylanilyticus]|uniref:Polysaccharide biosynthesis protein n=1 Tax=Lysinibacillus xylanilyticus TaxID=582475 RepID=A0A0K9F5Z1_9BACI|nr:lipopolysaccharide biosynthesis protein [Lysinibacillus xylanilyticus]KMY29627.1 polysaccharide biosynthesis protein [Lysinibacillus xylanilyticus]